MRRILEALTSARPAGVRWLTNIERARGATGNFCAQRLRTSGRVADCRIGRPRQASGIGKITARTMISGSAFGHRATARCRPADTQTSPAAHHSNPPRATTRPPHFRLKMLRPSRNRSAAEKPWTLSRLASVLVRSAAIDWPWPRTSGPIADLCPSICQRARGGEVLQGYRCPRPAAGFESPLSTSLVRSRVRRGILQPHDVQPSTFQARDVLGEQAAPPRRRASSSRLQSLRRRIGFSVTTRSWPAFGVGETSPVPTMSFFRVDAPANGPASG